MQNLRIKLEKHLNRRNKNDNSKNKESFFWMHGGSGICIGNNRVCKRTTILPANATIQELSYHSSNVKVATINGMGRIIAVKEGTTKITVTCGKVKNKFQETIVEDSSKEETVAVWDVEIWK